MISRLLIFCSIFYFSSAVAQVKWISTSDTVYNPFKPMYQEYSTKTDKFGNTYVITEATDTSWGYNRLLKFNKSGQLMFDKPLKYTARNRGEFYYQIAFDTNQNVYLCGNRDIPPSPTQFNNLISLVKLDPTTGDTVFTRQWSNFYGYATTYLITCDNANNVLIGGAAQTVMANGNDWFFIKYDSQGQQLFYRTFNSSIGYSDDYPRAIITDKMNNIYLAGKTVDPSFGFTTVGIVKAYRDNGDSIFTKYIDPTLWSNGGQSVEVSELDLDFNQQPIITGIHNYITTNGLYKSDVYAAALNSQNGSFKWFKSNLNVDSVSKPKDIVADSSNNVYVLFTTMLDSVSYELLPDGSQLATQNYLKLGRVVTKIDSSGQTLWTNTLKLSDAVVQTEGLEAIQMNAVAGKLRVLSYIPVGDSLKLRMEQISAADSIEWVVYLDNYFGGIQSPPRNFMTTDSEQSTYIGFPVAFTGNYTRVVKFQDSTTNIINALKNVAYQKDYYVYTSDGQLYVVFDDIKMRKVKLFALNGTLISEIDATADKVQFNTSLLPSSIYFVYYEGTTKKVLIAR